MPMIPGRIYTKQDAPSDATEAMHMQPVPYHEAIGSLMYVSIATHPNITFAMLALSQFLDNPREVHWDMVKHVFCYLAGTKTLMLTYSGEQHDLEGYTDVDGAMQEHQKVILGNAFLIDGGAISWSLQK
jgi:hypothetical protein